MFLKSLVSFVIFTSFLSLINATPITPQAKANYLGCYEDKEVRDLGHQYDAETLTVEICIDICVSKGYPFAGVQYGYQCFCGNFLKYQKLDESECDYSCNGNPDETCGGLMRNSVYKTGLSEIKKPKPANYLGCFQDSDVKDLGLYTEDDNLTVDSCVNYCDSLGYPFAGVQYGSQCYCGNFYGKYGKAEDKECDNNCVGDITELCGGTARNSVYRTNATNIKRPLTSNHLGCFEDREEDADLFDQNQVDDLTIEKCIESCRSERYRYAGVQAGTKCYCDNAYGRYERRENNECDFNCAGDITQLCGGYYRNSIYRVR